MTLELTSGAILSLRTSLSLSFLMSVMKMNCYTYTECIPTSGPLHMLLLLPDLLSREEAEACEYRASRLVIVEGPDLRP